MLLEAMASGTPVIASDSIGNNEIIEEGKTGFLYTPGDSTGFQKKLKLILTEKEQVALVVENAREAMVARYSWKSVAKKYLVTLGMNSDAISPDADERG